MATNGSDNNQNNPIINGDILGSLTSDVSQIRTDTSAIRNDTSILSSVDQHLTDILQQASQWSQQDARSRIYDTSRNGRNGQPGPFNRDNRQGDQQQNQDTRNQRRTNADQDAADVVDELFNQIGREMFGAGFQGAMQQNMKDFAAAMGLQLEDLPGAFGRTLVEQLKGTEAGKHITERMNGAMDDFINQSVANMRTSINDYYDRITRSGQMDLADAAQQKSEWEDVLDRMAEEFRNRQRESANAARNAQNQQREQQRQKQQQNRDQQNQDTRNQRRTKRTEFDPSGFFDTFFDEIEKDLFGANFHGALEASLKDFADAMGLSISDLPATMGRELAAQFRQSQIGQDIIQRTNQHLDRFITGSLDRMRGGIGRYYDRAVRSGEMGMDEAQNKFSRWTKVFDKISENFGNRRTTPENDPTPGGADDGPVPPENPNPTPGQDQQNNDQQDEEVLKVLDDKLQYLYPIYNTIESINKGVEVIASSIGSDSDIFDDYKSLFDQNGADNKKFLDDAFSQITEKGQGGSGGILDDILGSLFEDGAGAAGAEAGAAEGALAEGALEAGAGLEGLAAAGPYAAAGLVMVKVGAWALDKAMENLQACFKPLQDSIQKTEKTIRSLRNRFFNDERKKLEASTTRLEEDIKVLVETPFNILKDAAEAWYEAWDSNLKTINATQGYTKADLQDLMANYAERLRQEGLGEVVSAADISDNLAKVLESGLSGQAAEEFAYLATVLENAVPTQDFFGYASTYASIAANQIAMGKSQSEAIQAANDQLTQFASSLLYSSRQLSGGFATNLSSASDLLENAVKIANTAGIADSSYISATLAAVSSTVGAIAPDLASTITDAIVDAALGGNSEELVALRSLAETGASNTAFLNAFARDPQGVLSTLFGNLAEMQNLNTTNFMEVAESLSHTFGLSLGAFTRIDFQNLSNAVDNIEISLQPLQKNLQLLQDGQTTTTAEQLKMTEINKMILDEGLSYVLDNEAARSIQEHMWQQEIAAELQETTYAVDLRGTALDLLLSIKETIHNILNFLNPFSWLGTLLEVINTGLEEASIKDDLKAVLEAGKVGQGNSESFYNLTNYDVDRLTNKPGNLAEVMSGYSAFRSQADAGKFLRAIPGLSSGLQWSLSDVIANAVHSSQTSQSGLFTSRTSDIESQYSFATKGLYNAISSTSFATQSAVTRTAATVSSLSDELISSQQNVNNQSTANMRAFIDTMEESVKNNKSFDQWIQTSQNYGISKLETALDDFGITLVDLESRYQAYQAQQSTQYEYERNEKEEGLWDKLREFMDEDLTQFFDDVKTRLDTQIEILTSIDSTLATFLDVWQNDWFLESWKTGWLEKAWRTEWIQDAWNTTWVQEAWRNEWLQSAWKTDWLEQAWGADWLQQAWRTEWLQDAWRSEWLQTNWQQKWLQDAWQNSWLTQAWGEDWLNQAFRTEWIEQAWKNDWIEEAWKNGFIEMWKTEWLKKAWNEAWLEDAWSDKWLNQAWRTDWLQKAWTEDWLEKAWSTDWLATAWAQNWLEEAWKTDWIQQAWDTRWLQENWTEKWLEQAWKSDWLNTAWQQNWIDEAWNKKWIQETFQEKFVNDIITMLWGNRWWEFFNIFRDRFGGISTEAGDGVTSGATKIDTEGLYQIYTQETGQAATNALDNLEETDETGDAILALVKELTKNTVDLRDPQVQTNVLLSQILVVLEAIMQAENVAGGASLATTLASLGLGLTTQSVTDTTTNGGIVSL